MENEHLLKSELAMYGIEPHGDHVIVNRRGGKKTVTVGEHLEYLQSSIAANKVMFFEFWRELVQLLKPQSGPVSANEPTQRMFVNAVKRLDRLVRGHQVLAKYADAIRATLSCDVNVFSEEVMSKVIELQLGIQWVDHLVRADKYRTRLLKAFVSHHGIRTAETNINGVQGPWSNLDVPMKERVWSWAEDAEDFEESTTQREKSQRYQLPETYNTPDEFEEGFYWREPRNDPYAFGDEDNDPYPHYDSFNRP
jgi:hypothetical protein